MDRRGKVENSSEPMRTPHAENFSFLDIVDAHIALFSVRAFVS